MIIYCGLRHFYIHHFEQSCADTYYILTHNGEIWDFSPQLREVGFNGKTNHQIVWHLDKPVLTVPIELEQFESFSRHWHQFSMQYTADLEPEYPHAWYLRFQQKSMAQQFTIDFERELKHRQMGGIWGGGPSKLVAKLAAHSLVKNTIITQEQTEEFLNQLPLYRLPIPELAQLERLGIKTIGQLAKLSLIELGNHFGSRAPTLQQLGRGEDPAPFQTKPVAEYCWTLDCTTLEGFLQPLTPSQIQPYLKQGLVEISSALQAQSKVTNELKLKIISALEEPIERKRTLKEPTNDLKTLLRLITGLLPQVAINSIAVTAGKLQPAPTTQLNIFYETKNTLNLGQQKLPKQTQVGVRLPRRERFLILWEEYFRNEQAD